MWGPPRDHTGGDRRPVASTPGDRNFCPAGGICGYSSQSLMPLTLFAKTGLVFAASIFPSLFHFAIFLPPVSLFFSLIWRAPSPVYRQKHVEPQVFFALGIQGDRPCCGSLNWLDKRGKLVFDRLPSFNKNKIVV